MKRMKKAELQAENLKLEDELRKMRKLNYKKQNYKAKI